MNEIDKTGNLLLSKIWKIVWPQCAGDTELATLLTNRAYRRKVPLKVLRHKGMFRLIDIILCSNKVEVK